jgi:hypothetical protein
MWMNCSLIAAVIARGHMPRGNPYHSSGLAYEPGSRCVSLGLSGRTGTPRNARTVVPHNGAPARELLGQQRQPIRNRRHRRTTQPATRWDICGPRKRTLAQCRAVSFFAIPRCTEGLGAHCQQMSLFLLRPTSLPERAVQFAPNVGCRVSPAARAGAAQFASALTMISDKSDFRIFVLPFSAWGPVFPPYQGHLAKSD